LTISAGPDRKGTNDCADEVTLSRKGAKSRTQGRKLRSSRTKVKPRVVSSDESQAIIKLKAHARDLEKKLEARTHDLAEALEQQTATSEVLKVISSSPGDLQPVFEAMLGNASRICQSKFGVLWLVQDDGFRPAAIHNLPPALTVERQRNQFSASFNRTTCRAEQEPPRR
jgi:hypothetical protein